MKTTTNLNQAELIIKLQDMAYHAGLLKDITELEELSFNDALYIVKALSDDEALSYGHFAHIAPQLLAPFAKFMLCASRGGRAERIYRTIMTNTSMLTPCGLFERLVYDVKADKVTYIAGQSYPDELATLRDLTDINKLRK